MTAIAQDELAAIRQTVRRLFTDRHGESAVRATMETPCGFDPVFWRKLVELGVTGLAIDPAHGGLGGGAIEVEAIMEEAGAVLLGAPLLTNFIAAELVANTGARDAAERLLPAITGGSIAAVALTGDSGTWTHDGLALREVEDSVLSGHASFVLHGQNADIVLAAARTFDGFGIFELAPGVTGLTIEPLPAFDRTLRLARLTFDRTPARRICTAGWPAVEKALDFARIALAGEAVGGARRVLEMTTQYAKTRHQFGRAIGSFQAIKHMAANLLLETESATSAARAAAVALARNAHDRAELVALASFVCADAYDRVTADAVQMHGGIAFTWAHPVHLYLRRARALAQLFGNPTAARERYLRALGA